MPPVVDPRRNIELKARDEDPERSLEVCRMLGAADHDVIEQLETYFNVASGRLKLRRETPGTAHLIHYERADEPQQRESRYRVVEIQDAAQLHAALAAALGLSVVVAKRRRLHLGREVRIHLDQADGLGAFIELGAAASRESDLTREHALVDELRAAFAITDAHLVAQGYAAQLQRQRATASQPTGGSTS